MSSNGPLRSVYCAGDDDDEGVEEGWLCVWIMRARCSGNADSAARSSGVTGLSKSGKSCGRRNGVRFHTVRRKRRCASRSCSRHGTSSTVKAGEEDGGVVVVVVVVVVGGGDIEDEGEAA